MCMASYKLRMGCQHNYEKKECSKCIQCSSLAGESPVVRCASSLGTVTYHKAKRSTEQCQPQPTPFLRQVVKGCFHEEGGRDREYLCRSVIVSQCAVQVRHILVNRKRYIYIFFLKKHISPTSLPYAVARTPPTPAPTITSAGSNAAIDGMAAARIAPRVDSNIESKTTLLLPSPSPKQPDPPSAAAPKKLAPTPMPP